MSSVSLSALPSDCLEHVINNIDGASLFRLLLSGDKRLTRSIYLVPYPCIDLRPHRPISWPKILNNFQRIHSLTLKYPEELAGADVKDFQLTRLSSALRHLSLRFFSAELTFLRDWNSKTYHQLQHVLPNLTSLRIHGHPVLGSGFLRAIEGLNLTRLSLPTAKHLSFISRPLPTSLTSLHLPLPDYDNVSYLAELSGLQKLKTQTRHFSVDYGLPTYRMTSLSVFGRSTRDLQLVLPSTLTTLQGILAHQFDNSLTDLITLLLEFVDPVGQAALLKTIVWPQHLTDLTVKGLTVPLSETQAKKLPRTLTRLDYAEYTTDALHHLPPNLTEFHLHSCELRPVTAYLLPSKLRVLISTSYVGPDSFQLLPRTLTTLRAPIISSLLPHHVEALPIGLLEFSATKDVSGPTSTDVIKALPRNLTILTLSHRLLSSNALQFLPPCLRVLNMNNHELRAQEVLNNLPQMTVSRGMAFAVEEKPVQKRRSAWDDDPPSSSIQPPASSLPAKAPLIYFTMPYLQTLEMDECSGWLDLHLRLLPRSLTRLNLGSAPDLTGSGFADLPPMLNSFVIRAPNIEGGSLALLPRTLTRLVCNAKNVCAANLHLLPDNMVDLFLFADSGLTWQDWTEHLPPLVTTVATAAGLSRDRPIPPRVSFMQL